ncbi:MAG: hypothetical protein ACRENO_04065 [Thermodesulfobacteriota bacterium]
MDYSGTFPFGWLRGFQNDNWQILWDKNSGNLFIKSAAGSKVKLLSTFTNWKDAKHFSDRIIADTSLLEK